jgi:hypothetical protein
MLELIQSVHLFAGIVILGVLMLIVIFGSNALRWSQMPRQNERRADYAPLLRKRSL